MRTIDDRIVQALNTTIPTDSFAGQVDAKRQCKQLYEEMLQAHQSREKAIKKCVAEVSTTVDKLREQKDKDSDNLSLNTSLRQEQYKLRAIRAELNVEEIIRDRSAKVFHERCRLHYTPDS